MGRRLIVGDIHGSYKALMEVLEKASFDRDNDTLYFTGDVSDGYPQVFECLTFLLALPHFHAVIGNHDVWLQRYLAAGLTPSIWVNQGGQRTIENIEKKNLTDAEKHQLADALRSWPYVIAEDDFILTHGGPGMFFDEEDMSDIARIKRELLEYDDSNWQGWLRTRQATVNWDRSYYAEALYDQEHGITAPSYSRYKGKKRLFIGHTEIGSHKPFISKKHNAINVDTAAGSYGCLTLMDMDTLEYWQSKKSKRLYGFCSIGR